jgi:8-oxo-dGTP pyrophosphatase MutT (NUDIX family)
VEELVDLVDKYGKVRRRGVPRAEVRRRKEEFLSVGLYQPIVIVVVTDGNGGIVTQVRGHAKGGDGNGEFDHVCGVIASGEAWQEAAEREALEEIGVRLDELSMVVQGVNVYRRHRTLAVARASGPPKVVNPNEVADVFIAQPDELHTLRDRGEVFVRGFFADLQMALASLSSTRYRS